MEERHYRMLLAILGGIAAMVLVVRIGELTAADAEGAKLGWTSGGRIVGLVLLLVAIAGLWSWRNWGFWLLGLATLVALAAAIPDGLFAAFWRSFLHLTTILLTTEQYFTRKQEAEEAASKPDQPSSDYTPRPR
jgi:hypothetical protein